MKEDTKNICLWGLVVVAVFVATGLDASAATITVTNTEAPEGATVMVPVTYAAPAEQLPATLVMRMSYALSLTALEALEVVAAPLLAQHNKSLDFELTDGIISIAIFGGQSPVPGGTLLHLVMRLKSAAQVGNIITIQNVTADGADAAAKAVTVQVVSGAISVVEDPGKHSADTTEDWSITLPELLRVIQLYNARAYHCSPLGEDGYGIGPGDQTCAPHHGDYAPADWVISFSELLRLIQLYNAPYGMYHTNPTTEDGFAPGPFGYAP